MHEHNWWDFLSKFEEAKNPNLVLCIHVLHYQLSLHFDRFVYPGIQNLNFNHINIVCNTSQFLEEPYSTENLHNLSGHLKFLSEPIPLTTVNFNDVQVQVHVQYTAFTAVMKRSPILFFNLMSSPQQKKTTKVAASTHQNTEIKILWITCNFSWSFIYGFFLAMLFKLRMSSDF